MEARKIKRNLGTSIFAWILVFGSTVFGLIRYLMTILPLLDLPDEPKSNYALVLLLLLVAFVWIFVYATRTVKELYEELGINSSALQVPGLTALPILFGGNLFSMMALSAGETEGKFLAFLMLLGTYIWALLIAGLRIALNFGFTKQLNAKIDQICQQGKQK